MMCKAAAAINWRYPGDAIPAFVTLAVMPFTYSIAYGLIGGIVTYAIINTTVWIIEKASGGRWVPPGKIHKEPWTYKLVGGVLPPWVVRAARGKRDFWHEDDEVVEMAGVSRDGSSDGGKPEGNLDATPTSEVLPVKGEAYRDTEAKTHDHAL
jgi:AGZA family xanthine/uracil permease-like MFS transporter